MNFRLRHELGAPGKRKKPLLRQIIYEEAHLYVWDEPLNYLDVISRIQSENLILECKPGMVLVEHGQLFLERVGTNIPDLDFTV